jgi:hypothetical protein
MDKLSRNDVQKVKDVVTSFIKETNGCEDEAELHKQALKIMGEPLGDKPALLKQAARTYNSNKALFKLSSEDTANTTFGLLNPDKLFNEASNNSVNRTLEKAASCDVVVFSTNAKPIEKAASAMKETKEEVKETPMSAIQFDNYMNDTVKDVSTVLTKLASRCELCEREELLAKHSFFSNFRVLNKEAKAKVAKHIVDTYRDLGKELIDEYNSEVSAIDKVASFNISKSAKNYPHGDIYTKASDVIVATYAKNQAQGLIKEACANYAGNFSKVPGLYTMYKAAASAASTAVGTVASKPIAEALFPELISSEDAYEKVLSKKLLNELREIEVRNVLVDMYSEPFIASYPADEIEKATTTALQMLPTEQRRHPRKHTSLLKTWVAEILGRGTNLSASDADKVLKAQEVIKTEDTRRAINRASNLY